MLGIRYLKVAPTTYVMHYKEGRVVKEGPGLSFFLQKRFGGLQAWRRSTLRR